MLIVVVVEGVAGIRVGLGQLAGFIKEGKIAEQLLQLLPNYVELHLNCT